MILYYYHQVVFEDDRVLAFDDVNPQVCVREREREGGRERGEERIEE